MRIGKPVTQGMKDKVNRMYIVLRRGGYFTKEQLAQELDIKSERAVRDVMSTLSKRNPIIAMSDNKGYKLAMTTDDLEEVVHSWQEIDSRIEELDARRKQLIAFYDKMTGRG